MTAQESPQAKTPGPKAEVDLSKFGPILNVSHRLMYLAVWVSPQKLLSPRCPFLRPRRELTPSEVKCPEFAKKRARAIDWYIIAWWTAEVALTLGACCGPWPGGVAMLAAILVLLRIVEILQVTVNAALFDSLSGRDDEMVASRARMIVLSAANFIELIVCFGVMYAMSFHRLHGVGRPATAFYFSTITQLTIGFGDVYPTGWLRILAAVQGLSGMLFVVLVFGRFVASLPRVRESPGEAGPGAPK